MTEKKLADVAGDVVGKVSGAVEELYKATSNVASAATAAVGAVATATADAAKLIAPVAWRALVAKQRTDGVLLTIAAGLVALVAVALETLAVPLMLARDQDCGIAFAVIFALVGAAVAIPMLFCGIAQILNAEYNAGAELVERIKKDVLDPVAYAVQRMRR